MEVINDQQKLLIAIRSGELPSERSKEFWSDEEDAEFKRMYCNGIGISAIALTLQRSENAVVQRLMTMSMLTPPCNQRTHGAKLPKCRCPRCLETACPEFDKKEGICRAGRI